MSRGVFRRAFTIGAVLLFSVTGSSVSLMKSGPAQAAETVLTVTGAMKGADNQGKIVFTKADWAELPPQKITTHTPWHDGAVTFEGPLLRDILAAVGVDAKQTGLTIKAIAVNDYSSDIPIEDAQLYDLIIADKINGKPIPLREKGPLFVMYPFDAVPALKNPTFEGRCVWQLVALDVRSAS